MLKKVRGGPRTAETEKLARSVRRVAVTSIAVGNFPDEAAVRKATKNWAAGPLPLSLESPSRSATANLGNRAAYLDSPLVESILQGTASRSHMILAQPIRPQPHLSIWALELVELGPLLQGAQREGEPDSGSLPFLPSARFALILQATVAPQQLSLAQTVAAVRHVTPRALPAEQVLRTLVTPRNRDGPELFRLVMVTRADQSVPHLSSEVDERREQHWAFCLASATLPRDLADGLVPDFEADDDVLDQQLPGGTYFAPSADWRVAVLRTGAAFVGRRPDRRPAGSDLWQTESRAESDGNFFDAGELHVRTIYADTVLMALVQRHALLLLRNRVLATSRRAEDVDDVRSLEGEIARFRERFWWTTAARGGIGHQLLEACHLQHGLPGLFEQVESDAASVALRVQLAAERGRTGVIALIGLLGLFSVLLAICRQLSFADRPGTTLAIAFGLFVVLTAVLLWIFRDLAHAIREALRRAHRPWRRRTRRPYSAP